MVGFARRTPHTHPSAPEPAWVGAQQVLVRGQRGCLGQEFTERGWLQTPRPLPQMGSHGGCLLPVAHTTVPVGYGPSTARGQVPCLSMSAPSLIIRAAGTRLVRRGAKRLGPVGPGRWMAGQQAPRPSPMQEAMGNHPAGHAPPMGKGPIKKPAVYILNKNSFFLSSQLSLEFLPMGIQQLDPSSCLVTKLL